jgi:hypothetical protein
MVIFYILILLSTPTLLFSYGTAEKNIGPSKKHSINFYGTLEVHQGQTFEVENISIQDEYRQIPMYDCPGEGYLEKAVANKETGKMEIRLKEDPTHDMAVTKIDLEEVEEIRVDHEPIYVFQQPQHRPSYFYRATIISKSSSKTKHYALIPEHIKLQCDEVDAAGPIEKSVPLSAVKSLKIKGFSQRMDQEQTKNNAKK